MKIGKLSALAAAVVSLPTFTGAETMDIGMATVTAIDGVVLVSADGRFATATVGTELVRGSRVLTMEGASTTVTYSDGCRLQLGGNTMAVLRDADECTDGSVQSEAVGAQYASLGMPTTVAPAGVASTVVAAGSVGAIGGAGAGAGAAGAAFSGLEMAGAAGGVALAGAIVIKSSGNGDGFVSPE